MQKVGLVYSDIYLQHNTGFFHPEKLERLKVVIDTLKNKKILGELSVYAPIEVKEDIISYVHSKEYISYIKQIVKTGKSYIDSPDTPICENSYLVAKYSVGGGIKLADEIMHKNIKSGFSLSRPPGHHATYNKAMGFCIFNNIAAATPNNDDENPIDIPASGPAN